MSSRYCNAEMNYELNKQTVKKITGGWVKHMSFYESFW